MARVADAVVIGGGVVGASAFFHLVSLGLPRVVLCERRRPGSGASGASGGFIQYHFCRNATETRLTQASLPYFERWDELVGAGSPGFLACGYVRLEPAERESVLRERVAMLQAFGVWTEEIGPNEVRMFAPYLHLDGIAVGAIEQESGYADANRTLAGFLDAGERGGGEVLTDTTVTALRVERDGIAGVETTTGPIDAPLVILAAGAWTNALLEPTGLSLPLEGALTQWIGFSAPDMPPEMLTVGDGVSGSYFLQHDDLILVGLGGGSRQPLVDPDAEEPPIPGDIVRLAQARLAERLIGAGNSRHVGGRTGPISLTPDDFPIIDRHPEIEGLSFFAGDGGASFKTAPVLGRVLAEQALGKPTTVDVATLGLARFNAHSSH